MKRLDRHPGGTTWHGLAPLSAVTRRPLLPPSLARQRSCHRRCRPSSPSVSLGQSALACAVRQHIHVPPRQACELSPDLYRLVTQERYALPRSLSVSAHHGHAYDRLPKDRARNLNRQIRRVCDVRLHASVFQPNLLSALPSDARVVR